MENNKNLWNKTTNELTVGDAVKLNVAALGIMLGGCVVFGIGISTWEALAANRSERKLRKQNKNTEK